MTRKSLLAIIAATIASLFRTRQKSRAETPPAPDSGRVFEKRVLEGLPDGGGEKMQKFDFAGFPFEHVETDGVSALAEYEKLKSAGPGIPVIAGSDEDVANIAQSWENRKPPNAAKILEEARLLGPDFDIKAMRKKEFEDLVSKMKSEGKEIDLGDFDAEMEAGSWPATVEAINSPTVTDDVLSRKPLERVYILIFPASADHEIPAFAGWGDWNENPPPEVHVAMLKKWNEKYGAELVGMTGDVLNLRVSRRPVTKEEALALAEEMYHYCGDIVTQGVGDLAVLAAMLMVSDYWYFWWD
jgi:Domain of unknown function (DUF4253)